MLRALDGAPADERWPDAIALSVSDETVASPAPYALALLPAPSELHPAAAIAMRSWGGTLLQLIGALFSGSHAHMTGMGAISVVHRRCEEPWSHAVSILATPAYSLFGLNGIDTDTARRRIFCMDGCSFCVSCSVSEASARLPAGATAAGVTDRSEEMLSVGPPFFFVALSGGRREPIRTGRTCNIAQPQLLDLREPGGPPETLPPVFGSHH